MMESSTLESASPQGQTKPKVLYVMGAGRSGSTIFGVALGNCDGIFDAGELEAWLRRSGIPNFGGAERTKFWSDVHDVVGGDDLFGDQAWLCLEHSSSVFRVDRWHARRRLRRRYREITEALYRTVAEISGATYIVDTSHYPLRVRELRALTDIDLYLVYLVRDPRGVVASFDRRDVAQRRMAPVVTNAYLWLTHLLSSLVFLSHRRDRRLFVSYEDFNRNPESVLSRILELIGASVATPELSALKTGIPFQGNRLLRPQTIAFRGDTTSSFPRSYATYITKLIQLPWTLFLSHLNPRVTVPMTQRAPEA